MRSFDSILAGEWAENEMRKQFTASERVAIGLTVERERGKRAGRPSAEIRENFPELKQGRARDEAAEKAGFGNARTYEMAKSVVDRGAPELIAAMDNSCG